MARSHLRTFFAAFRLDLSPYLDSLGGFLPAVLPRQSAQQLQATVDSLALGSIRIEPANLKIAIDFTVETLADRPIQPGDVVDRGVIGQRPHRSPTPGGSNRVAWACSPHLADVR